MPPPRHVINQMSGCRTQRNSSSWPTRGTRLRGVLMQSFDLNQRYVLINGTNASDVEGGASFWERLKTDPNHARRVEEGWLVGIFPAEQCRVDEATSAGADPMVVIDAANVIGSRPTGWWRDRAGAAGVFTARVRRQWLREGWRRWSPRDRGRRTGRGGGGEPRWCAGAACAGRGRQHDRRGGRHHQRLVARRLAIPLSTVAGPHRTGSAGRFTMASSETAAHRGDGASVRTVRPQS